MGTVNARERFEETESSDDFPLDSIGAKVAFVSIDGLTHTKDDIVVESVQDLFKVTHFEELVLEAQEVRSRLQELGCFSDVAINIDTSRSGQQDYEVTFEVKELKRVAGSVNTMVGNNEGSLMTGFKLPNLLGRGEKLQADYTYGSKKTSTFNISLLKPLRSVQSVLTSNVFQSQGEHPSSGFKEQDRGLLLDLAFSSAATVQHNLQYEAVWRNLSSLNRSVAFAVREQSGHSLKSAVKHILSVDRRDEPIFPSSGSFFKLSQEFAGLGGNVGFFKNEVELQSNIPLGESFSFQGSFNGGLIKEMNNGKSFNMSDNFFLGGPLNVRGFDLRGLGPSSDGCSLGGTAFWATGAHLYAPLPFRPGKGGFGDLFRTHMFATAGNVGKFWLSGDLARDFEQVTDNFRWSYGLGLALKLGGVARIELNYCIPVTASRTDKVTSGLQFGVGVNFL